MTELVRCEWAGSDPLYVAYHDTDWGVPLHDPRRLFELLCLGGAPAGLAWSTTTSSGASGERAVMRSAFWHEKCCSRLD